MAATTSFDGFSKAKYDYEPADLKNLNALPLQGGNYLFAQRSGGRAVIVFAAETDCIRKAVVNNPRWDEARDKHGAIFIFYRLNPQPSRRRLELHDLIRQHNPPMNPQGREE